MPELRRIVRESVPVLVAAAALSAMAGVTLEKSFDDLDAFPALLVLAPAFVVGRRPSAASCRAGCRASSSSAWSSPSRSRAGRPGPTSAFVFLLALPVYAFNGLGAHLVAGLLDERSPGSARCSPSPCSAARR